MNDLHNIKIKKNVKFCETRLVSLRSVIHLCRSNCATNILYMHRSIALYIAREARNRSHDDISAPRIPRVPLQLKAFTIDTRPIPTFPDVATLKGIVLVCIIRPRRHTVFFYRVCNQISRAAFIRYAKSQEGAIVKTSI